MFCPCVDCRNVCHQPVDTVLDHLVIRGMDHKYKRNSCWSIHGDLRNETNEDPGSSFEAYELFRTAFHEEEENLQSREDYGDQTEDSKEDSEFKKKVKQRNKKKEDRKCTRDNLSDFLM